MNKVIYRLMILIALVSTACSPSLSGGVKSAADEDAVTASMHGKRDRAKADAQVAAEKAKTEQPVPESAPAEPSKSESPLPSLFGYVQNQQGGFASVPGLLLSRAYLGSGAMPQNLNRACAGRCIGVISYANSWFSVQVGDVFINDMVTQSGVPVIRLSTIPLLGNAEAKVGIGLIPPNQGSSEGFSMTDPGIVAFHVACAARESCPNRVKIVLRGYQRALNGEMVPTGKCHVEGDGTVKLPSVEPWGLHIRIYTHTLRDC